MDDLFKEAHELFERLYDIVNILNTDYECRIDLLELHEDCYKEENKNEFI